MVIDQRFGRGAIIQEALNEALPRFYGEAVAENSLNPLAQPEVEVTKLEDGDSIEFTAEVDVRPDFDLPDFSTLTATVDATADGLEYEIGTSGMLDGLDEAVTGLSAGESAEFASTLVGGPQKGEGADITVTVTQVQEQE